MMILIGYGFLVDSESIQAVFRFSGKGVGSKAIHTMVNLTKHYWDETKTGPRVWDLTGRQKTRSLVVMKNGEMFVTYRSVRAIVKQLK